MCTNQNTLNNQLASYVVNYLLDYLTKVQGSLQELIFLKEFIFKKVATS